MAKSTPTLSSARVAKQSRGGEREANPLTEKVAEEPKKRLNADIPVSLHAQFKARVAGEGRKMNEVLVELVEEYLSK